MPPRSESPHGASSCTLLRLPASARTQLERHSYAGAPNETCGLLVGTRAAALTSVREITLSRNLETLRAGDRFTLDPVHLMQVENDARARGLEVVGTWHSHPQGPAVPSRADRAGAWENWSHVILSLTGKRTAAIRSWRLEGGDLLEESIGE